MTCQAIVHVGTHRTGTSSIQKALADEREGLLAKAGYRFPIGVMDPNCHVELQLASSRWEAIDEPEELSKLARTRFDLAIAPKTTQDWLRVVKDHVASTPGDRLIFSFEGLSLLRYPDEIDRLKQVFEGHDTWVVMFTREPNDFLKSFEWSLRVMGKTPATDPELRRYTGSDSWMVDYDTRLRVWRDIFGDDRVIRIDYDDTMRRLGSTVPAFFDFLGLVNPEGNARSEAYHLNSRPRSAK